MKRATKSFIFSVFLTVGLAAQNTPPSTNTGGDNAPSQVNPAPQASALRILTPVANQKVSSNAVDVRWQLENGGIAAGAPNYQVQLDGADPINTTSTEHSFAGLAPGQHTLVVRLVDANGIPIPGGSSQVQFVVGQQQQPANASPKNQSSLGSKILSAFFKGNTLQYPAIEETQDVPSSAGALPLLSVVGFGALIGGVISARRTRRK